MFMYMFFFLLCFIPYRSFFFEGIKFRGFAEKRFCRFTFHGLPISPGHWPYPTYNSRFLFSRMVPKSAKSAKIVSLEKRTYTVYTCMMWLLMYTGADPEHKVILVKYFLQNLSFFHIFTLHQRWINAKNYHIGPFFFRETIFADFGTILENKNCELHGGYGQWPSEIGSPWNLNLQKCFFSKSTKFDSLEKKGPIR